MILKGNNSCLQDLCSHREPMSAGEMKETLQILCLEDSPHDVELLRQRLEADGIAVDLTVVETRQNFLRAVEEGPFDLILSDYTIPGFGGREALILAKEKCPDVPFVFFSGTIGQERAVECVKIGATDFVLKDHPSRLIPAIQRALDEAAERERRREAERDLRTAEAQR